MSPVLTRWHKGFRLFVAWSSWAATEGFAAAVVLGPAGDKTTAQKAYDKTRRKGHQAYQEVKKEAHAHLE